MLLIFFIVNIKCTLNNDLKLCLMLTVIVHHGRATTNCRSSYTHTRVIFELMIDFTTHQLCRTFSCIILSRPATSIKFPVTFARRQSQILFAPAPIPPKSHPQVYFPPKHTSQSVCVCDPSTSVSFLPRQGLKRDVFSIYRSQLMSLISLDDALLLLLAVLTGNTSRQPLIRGWVGLHSSPSSVLDTGNNVVHVIGSIRVLA